MEDNTPEVVIVEVETKKKGSTAKEWLKDTIIALVIAIIVLQFIKPTIVKESSMEPSLYENHYLLLNKMAYKFDEPDRGDIIVFKSELKDDKGKDKWLIKRIVGLPGDVITIANGKVQLNGKLYEEEYLNEGITDGELINYLVPKAEYFVMGDNRLVSLDSRYEEVGNVEEESIEGKAVFRVYPFDKIGTLD
ncbi:MAG: signal peptidase I [Clostridiales bacterium]|nr:signal peptidase I [Clostridiales bacterium]